MTQMILTAGSWLSFNFITSAYMAIANTYNNIKQTLVARARINRTISELEACSDRQLADMGIYRGCIREVAEGREQRD